MLHKYFWTEYSAFKQYSFHTSIYILVTFYIRTLDTCKKRGFPILKAIYKFEISFEEKNKHGFEHHFQRLESPFYFLSLQKFFNTDASWYLMNLTSHNKTLTGKREFDNLLFKGSLIAEPQSGMDLWTIMLTFSLIINEFSRLYHSINVCFKYGSVFIKRGNNWKQILLTRTKGAHLSKPTKMIWSIC